MPEESYPVLICDYKNDKYVCKVLVGDVELTLAFSKNAIESHGLKVWDRFRWRPTETGETNFYNIIPTQRLENMLNRPFPPLSEDIKRLGERE